MQSLFKKIKRRAGVIVLALFALYVILYPLAFITLGGDIGYKLFMIIIALILAYLAISQMDRHWSESDSNKAVSLSNFMKNEANSNQKAWIYVAIIITIGHIISSVVSG